MKVRAIRGAITIPENSPKEIVSGTAELLREMIARNEIKENDIVSVIFTATEDLTAEFPAAAARELGFKYVPLLCTKELSVPEGIPQCIRILMHFYTEKEPRELRHVYLRGAKHLRTDLPE